MYLTLYINASLLRFNRFDIAGHIIASPRIALASSKLINIIPHFHVYTLLCLCFLSDINTHQRDYALDYAEMPIRCPVLFHSALNTMTTSQCQQFDKVNPHTAIACGTAGNVDVELETRRCIAAVAVAIDDAAFIEEATRRADGRCG
jgi:hypothetical protein